MQQVAWGFFLDDDFPLLQMTYGLWHREGRRRTQAGGPEDFERLEARAIAVGPNHPAHEHPALLPLYLLHLEQQLLPLGPDFGDPPFGFLVDTQGPAELFQDCTELSRGFRTVPGRIHNTSMRYGLPLLSPKQFANQPEHMLSELHLLIGHFEGIRLLCLRLWP